MHDLGRLLDARDRLREEIIGLSEVLVLKKRQQARLLDDNELSGSERKKRSLETRSDLPMHSPTKLNRSVLGQMMGHLNKARAEEAAQADRIRRQQDRLNEVERKEKQQLWDNMDEEIRELELTVSEKSRDLDSLERRIVKENHRSVVHQVVKQWQVMENFIRTATEPCLFWMPQRHNPQTRRLQDDTKHEIQQKLKNLRKQVAGGD